MKKNFKNYLIVWAVLVVIFNVICFLTPTEKNGSFWTGYIFIMLSFIGQLACAYVVLKEGDKQKLFYKLPLLTVSFSSLIVSVIVGSLCMAIPNTPNWFGTIVGVVILGFTVIAVVKASAAADIVLSIDEKVKTQTFFIKALLIDVNTLLTKAKDSETQAEIKKVCDAVKYSDPMSSDALASTEAQITLTFNNLSSAVESDDIEAVKKLTADILVLIKDRNSKCKLLK